MQATNQIDQAVEHGSRWKFVSGLFAVILIAYFFWAKPPFSFAFDPNEEKCLPDLHLALLISGPSNSYARNQLVYFEPFGSLSYVKQQYVMKLVAGVPGDHLVIKSGRVLINGSVVATGFPLSNSYKGLIKNIEKDEIIPPNSLFMVGTHPNSDDSRYWGYLPNSMVSGVGYKIY